MTVRRVYKTDDGCEFEDHRSGRAHDLRLAIVAIPNKNHGVWDEGYVIERVVEVLRQERRFADADYFLNAVESAMEPMRDPAAWAEKKEKERLEDEAANEAQIQDEEECEDEDDDPPSKKKKGKPAPRPLRY